MRDEPEIRRALVILGTAFASPELRRWVFGGMNGESERAWFCFATLGWVIGATECVFVDVLEHVEKKLMQFPEPVMEETDAQ